MSFIRHLAAVATALTLASPVSAQELIFVTEGVQSTKAFFGLNWAFGAGASAPETILGVVYGDTSADNDLSGARLSLHFGTATGSGFGLKKIKLTGLWGAPSTQGELGLGYNLGAGSVFGVAGLNAGNFSFGGDFGFAGDFSGFGTVEGYFGIQSFGKFDEATQSITIR